ncbi:hemolysin family protein [Jatrophihabitans sp. YIM 134969]
MTSADVVALVAAVLLVPIGGTLAAVDAALSWVSVARVEDMRRDDRPGARSLAVVLGDRARYTNLLLLLRLICELTSTVLVTIVVRRELGGDWWIATLTVAVMVFTSYVLVGVGPRTLGRQHPYAVALRSATVVRILGSVLNPLASLLVLIGNAVTPGRGFRDGPFSSEIELRELVDLAEASGVVEEAEREMIQSVFGLGDTIAREVMVPRPEMVWIESDKRVPQALALALRSGFSRIPVVGESIDEVVGVVYLKDLARLAQDQDRAADVSVADVMRSPSFVPETKDIDQLLREMQASRTHLSIVIDEYGGTAGLITIEDIVEEIVGEITDEYDVEIPPVTMLPDGSARVVARLSVDDLQELFDVEWPERDDDVETVGGLLAEALGRVPIPGAEATVHGLHLVAESGAGRRNRVGTVLVSRVREPADDDDQGSRQDGHDDRGRAERSQRSERADRQEHDRMEATRRG